MDNLLPRRCKVIRKNSNLYRVLSRLIRGETIALSQSTEGKLDHSLHCTLMVIEKMGIRLEKRSQPSPKINGSKKTQVRSYWLDDHNLLKAQNILEMSR